VRSTHIKLADTEYKIYLLIYRFLFNHYVSRPDFLTPNGEPINKL